MKEGIIFGVVTVFLFPLVIGLLFMISYMLHTMIYREKGLFIFEQRGFYLSFLFLLVFFVIIFFVTIHTGVINRMGLGLPTELTQLVMLGVGILIGIGLYYFEFYSTIFFKTISKYLPFLRERIFVGGVNVLKKKVILNFISLFYYQLE